jgi:hypothetical protein
MTGQQCLLFKSEQDDLQELQYLSALCKVRNASQKYSKTPQDGFGLGVFWIGLVFPSLHRGFFLASLP